MATAAADPEDLFAPEVIADPYTYFGRLRETDPVHWNPRAEMWILTRHEDLVWLLRHHELFSSAVISTDARPPHPPIDAADEPLFEQVRAFRSDQLVEKDRPPHQSMRARGARVLHAAGDGGVAPVRPPGRRRAPGRGRAAGPDGRPRGARRPAPRARDHADDGRARGGPRPPARPRRQAPLHQPRRARPDAPPDGGHRGDDRVRLAEGGRARRGTGRRLHLRARAGREGGRLHAPPGARQHRAPPLRRPRDDDEPHLQRHARVHPATRPSGSGCAPIRRAPRGSPPRSACATTRR